MNKINGLLACGICLCAVACGSPDDKAAEAVIVDSVTEALADGV